MKKNFKKSTIQCYKNNKPIDLNLKNIKFPVTAIASISHRISGVIIFIVFGILLIMLKLSFVSMEYFYQITLIINNYFVRFIIWNFLIFFVYHFINGIRHVLMDLGYLNKTLSIGKTSANITFILTGVLSVLIGILLC